MADLFDMNVGGLGFHLTSHVIAIAALFIACFAIAGYITFRDDSIPESALKGDVQGETVRIALPVNAAAHNDVYVVKQPANTMLVSLFTAVTDGYTVANNNPIPTTIGTTPTGADLMAETNIAAETVAVGAQPTAGFGVNGTVTLQANRYAGAGRTSVERDIYVRLAFPANAVTEAGEIMLQFDFYDDSGVAATPQ